MTASQTQCPVIGGIQNVTTGGVIQIESEQIYFLSASSTAFLNLTRGYNGTVATAHPVGSEVTIVERNIGVLAVPVQTTAVRDAIVPQEGMVVYNDDTDVLNVRTNVAWVELIADGIPASEKGAPNGVATLDGFGKVPVAQLPNAIMEFKGTWDASTNTPTLADGTGDNGDVYLVTVAGTQDLGSGPIIFDVNNFVIYNGTIWEKSGGTSLAFPLLAPDGSAAAPNYSWLTNPASGLFFNGEGRTALSDNGVEFMDFGANYVRIRTSTSLALQRDGGENDPSVGMGSTGTVGLSTSQTGDFVDTFHVMTSALNNGFMTTRFTVGPEELNSFTRININNNKLINLSDPTDPQDAATKFYVDNSTGLAATKALDNLASVAINTALLPNADGTLGFGSDSLRWARLHVLDGIGIKWASGSEFYHNPSDGYAPVYAFSQDSTLNPILTSGFGNGTFSIASDPEFGTVLIDLDRPSSKAIVRSQSLSATSAEFNFSTDPGVTRLQVWNTENGSLQDVLTKNSHIYAADGSLALPSFSFVTEDGLGAYRSGPGIYSIVSGGSEVAAFKPSGVQITADAFPATDGGSNLGTPSQRWGNVVLKDAVYFGVGDFQTKLGWALNTFTFTNTGTDLMTINPTVTNVRTPLKVNNAFILPLIAGTSGQVVTSDGAGNSSWATPTVGANQALSNLTSPPSINQHLLADSNGTRDIGQATPNRWRNGYINQLFPQGINFGTPGSAGSPIFTQNGQSTGLYFTGFGNSPLNYTKAGSNRGELATAGVNNNFTVAQAIGAVTYPAVDGSAGQVLETNGAGILSFVTPAAGVTYPLLAPDGSDAAPSYSFSSNSGHGLFAQSGTGWPAIANNGDITVRFGPSYMQSYKALAVTYNGAQNDGEIALGSDSGVMFWSSVSDSTFRDQFHLGTMMPSDTFVRERFRVRYDSTTVLKELRLWDVVEDPYVSFKCPSGLAGNVTWTLPSADGTSGQVLSTDGAGTLSWVTAGGMSFPILAPNGTSGAPSYSFSGDSTMGMWRTGGGKLSFMSNGTEVISFSDLQLNMELNQSSIVLDDTTGGSEFMRLVTGDYIELYAGQATSSIRALINATEVGRFVAEGLKLPDDHGYYFMSDYGFGPAGLRWDSTAGAMQITAGSQYININGSGGSGMRLINDNFSLEGISNIFIGDTSGNLGLSFDLSGASAFGVDLYSELSEIIFDDANTTINIKPNFATVAQFNVNGLRLNDTKKLFLDTAGTTSLSYDGTNQAFVLTDPAGVLLGSSTNNLVLTSDAAFAGSFASITLNGGAERIELELSTGIAGKFDSNATAGETRFMLWDVDTNTLQRVSVGAADSGGTGFKVLRIPN